MGEFFDFIGDYGKGNAPMEQSENFLLEELGDIVKEFDAIDKKLLLEIAKLIQIYKQQNL